MEVFEIVVAMLLGGAALAAVARRFGAPYPALVALAGATGIPFGLFSFWVILGKFLRYLAIAWAASAL